MGVDEIPIVIDAEAFTEGGHDITILNIEFALGPEFEIIEWEECLKKIRS